MLLKIIIIVLFILILASLISGFIFFAKDQGNQHSLRLMWALGTRVTLALLLVIAIGYGIYSGEFKSQAPWDKQLHSERSIN